MFVKILLLNTDIDSKFTYKTYLAAVNESSVRAPAGLGHTDKGFNREFRLLD